MMLADLSGVLFGAVLAMAGLAVMINFRGIVNYHVARSIQSARPFWGQPRRRSEEDIAFMRGLVHVVDRVLAVAMIAAGSVLLWQSLHSLVDG
ncbi:hypothetical protein AB0J72_16995 [Dactylosporangium sp. NPDC049742]|uniref:hypothetical protein n=1 Tax=Dactylosporangium sp. NPDC049742 TaxID=3154737 RepID=UPI003437D3A1